MAQSCVAELRKRHVAARAAVPTVSAALDDTPPPGGNIELDRHVEAPGHAPQAALGEDIR